MPGVMMLSRGIRRVPLNYEHPQRERFDYRSMSHVKSPQPVFDQFYVPAVREWLAGWERWQTSPAPAADGCSYEEWEGNGPDPRRSSQCLTLPSVYRNPREPIRGVHWRCDGHRRDGARLTARGR